MTVTDARVRMTENCTCGAGIRLVGEDGLLAESLLARWQAAHAGPGHVSCSANEARYVRNGYSVPAWMRRAGDSRD